VTELDSENGMTMFVQQESDKVTDRQMKILSYQLKAISS